MGNIIAKKQSAPPAKVASRGKGKKLGACGKFVLSDVTAKELEKRRIPVYPYLM